MIESYTHLQQDSQDVIIGLLQQIAAQNFTFGPGFLNSTNTSPSSPSFEPPLWAIRVNVLWFTSLLLSLSSASFGILVKQWLREYLALEYAAPRERLRARQYRNPAMSDWKVFEIAAFLPLLLQLSLGLFFVGLCFFTAAVHDSVGRTTIPLVCAWAFLLLMTTVAPLFSPRCPYKTTFLKRAFEIGRRYVVPSLRHLIAYILRFPYTFRATASRTWTSLILRAHDIFYHVDHATQSIEDNQIIINIEMEYEIQVEHDTSSTTEDSRGDTHPKNAQESDQEESQVVKMEAEDVEILLSVDSLMSDDGLLPTMLDALRQRSGASLATVVYFAREVIGRRVDIERGNSRLTLVPDLRLLSKYAWTTLIDAIVDVFLQHGPLVLDANIGDLVSNAIIIMSSRSNHTLSDHAERTLQKILLIPTRMPEHGCSDNIPLCRCLVAAESEFPNTPEEVVCPRCIMNAYGALSCQDQEHVHPSLRHLLDTHVSEDAFVASSTGLLQVLIRVLTSFLLRAPSAQMDWMAIPGSHEALHIVLQYGARFGRRNDAVKLCRQMLLIESGTHVLLVQFAALHAQCRVREDSREILRNVLRSTSLEGKLLQVSPSTYALLIELDR